MILPLRSLPILGILAFLALPLRADDHPGSSPDLRAGFYLMHDVCQRESQAHLVTLVKTTPKPVADYLDEISRAADDTLKVLRRLRQGDSSLRDAPNPLPPFEEATRAGIRADKQHEILFGTKGPAYVHAILLDQIEGANYVMHMAKVWSERDPDADRAATMRKVSARWQALRDEGTRLAF
jgi:hypothetical protein